MANLIKEVDTTDMTPTKHPAKESYVQFEVAQDTKHIALENGKSSNTVIIGTNGKEIAQLTLAVFIKEVKHPEWVANLVLVLKKTGALRMCIDFTGLSKVCPRIPSRCLGLIR
jgi:ribosomal protein S3